MRGARATSSSCWASGERGCARFVSVLWSPKAGGGAHRFANASGDIDVRLPELRGRRAASRIGRIEVSASDPGHDASASVQTWRFAYRGTKGDVLRLVAVRHEQIWRHDDGDAAGVVDNVVSTDLLTGVKVDVIEGDSHGRRRRRELESRVALRQPIVFDQFSFDFKGAAAETRFAFGRDFERR